MKYTFILVTLLVFSNLVTAQVSTQISYVNISKPGGGPVSSGDILEIRGVISVLSGTTITGVRFNGTVPAGTTYVPGTLAAKTNEGAIGFTNTGSYTDATGNDRGHITGSSVVINLGNSAGIPPAAGGSITGGTTVPRFYSSSTIIQATFRVRVTQVDGSVLSINGNSFTYNSNDYNLSTVNILLQWPYSCQSLNAANLVSDEFGGTFGSSTSQNRAASAITTGFSYSTIASGQPQDGRYSVVKNTSPTQYTGATPAGSDRVHGAWAIFGDHTGTTTTAGNPPSPNGVNGGYMLLVNASYTPSSVFTTDIFGLLPYTTYTLRFWIRNACGRCSGSPTGGSTSPAAPGVLPNVIFSVSGTDYYSSGDIPGDPNFTNGWVQKSFTFTTGNWNNCNINLRNNAPGGGGNDWAIDDISLNQCLIFLPATITNFSAYRLDGSSQLTWEVGAEENVKEYVVESSTNGKDFSSIGTVASRKKGGTYNYSDSRKIEGKVYYRLVTVDMDGKTYYSKIIFVSTKSYKNSSFKIVPNPSGPVPEFQLYSQSNQKAFIQVTDLSGRLMSSFSQSVKQGLNSFRMQGSGFASGIYLTKVTMDDGVQFVQRLVVVQ